MLALQRSNMVCIAIEISTHPADTAPHHAYLHVAHRHRNVPDMDVFEDRYRCLQTHAAMIVILGGTTTWPQ